MSATPTDLWPYNPNTAIIPCDLARSIRAWALAEMSEAQLHSYSQRQLLLMYVAHLGTILASIREPTRTQEESIAAARRVMGIDGPEFDERVKAWMTR
jgi:hypothetical protein